ncbi:MAG: family 16 glycosylhydrolase [Bacteroidales bacterium]|nr:family 16 glycosylhydrolase [Bacteroidales bacterium]
MRKILMMSWLVMSVFVLMNTALYAQEYELVWSDEFDGSGLDTAIWNYEIGTGNNNELQYSTSRPENIFVSDGKLTIRGLQESYGGMNYTSARINTHDKFNFTYGKIEAYMKLPYGQGIWPAFWLLGESIYDIGWPGCGEIDIMEMVGGDDPGKGDDIIHSTLHWGSIINGGHPYYGLSYQLDEGIFNDAFHLVSTVWDDNTIRTYCDSVLFFTIDVHTSEFDAFDERFFIILNMAIGGDWPGSPDASTVFPQDFQIDYVRLYKSAETLEIDGPAAVNAADSSLEYSIMGGEGWSYEWILPEGVTVNGTPDSSHVFLNWGCNPGTLKCHIKGDAIEDTLSLDVALTEPAIEGPLFFADHETGLVFSFPELAGSDYSWAVPTDASITGGQGSSSITVDWGTTADTVHLVVENTCGTSSYSRLLLAQGQYPYPDPFTPQVIPGTIESTDFDYGGEGVAYHDNNTQNQGSGPRQDEGVDTEYNDGGGNIGWNEGGEWTEYTIAVEETGYYTIQARVASQNTSGISPLNILFNGENRTGNMTVPATGSWSTFRTITAEPVQLYTTDTLMRLDLGSGGFNMGRVIITPYTGSGLQKTGLSETIRVYPNPATSYLIVESDQGMTGIRILDLTGRVQKQIDDPESFSQQLDTSGLPEGVYILQVVSSNSSLHTMRFIKE